MDLSQCVCFWMAVAGWFALAEEKCEPRRWLVGAYLVLLATMLLTLLFDPELAPLQLAAGALLYPAMVLLVQRQE